MIRLLHYRYQSVALYSLSVQQAVFVEVCGLIMGPETRADDRLI